MCLWAQVPRNSLILMLWLEMLWDCPPLVSRLCLKLRRACECPLRSLLGLSGPCLSMPQIQALLCTLSAFCSASFLMKGPPSPELPEPDPKRSHPCPPPATFLPSKSPSPTSPASKMSASVCSPISTSLPHPNQGLSGLAFLQLVPLPASTSPPGPFSTQPE